MSKLNAFKVGLSGMDKQAGRGSFKLEPALEPESPPKLPQILEDDLKRKLEQIKPHIPGREMFIPKPPRLPIQPRLRGRPPEKYPEIKAPAPNMKEGSRTCRDSQTFMAVLDDILGRNSRLTPIDGTTRLLLDGGTLKPKA
jgi:hypothetical protein